MWVKTITNTVRGFYAHDCFYRASALTFYTLLSLVPLLAIAFGIAQHVGLEKYLEEEITRRFLDQPEVALQLKKFALSVLQQPSGGFLASVGLLFLLWTALQLFYNIEHSLNAIWGVEEERSYLIQLRDYLLMVLLCPLIVLASAGLSFLVAMASQRFHLHWLTHVGYSLLSLLLNGTLFSVIYYTMPNTQVPWKPALIAGFIAGVFYQITQWVYLYFQIGVASYGAIYGSFAALPLFLVWLNTSWTIFLGGAELAHQLQTQQR